MARSLRTGLTGGLCHLTARVSARRKFIWMTAASIVDHVYKLLPDISILRLEKILCVINAQGQKNQPVRIAIRCRRSPAQAATPDAPVLSGTTWKGIRWLDKVSISSPPRPDINGSPPLCLSTRLPSLASQTSKWLMYSCDSVCPLRALPASPVSALQSAASNTFFDSLPRHLGATVNFDMNFFYYYRVTEDSGRYLRNDKKHQPIIAMTAVSTPEIPAPRLITAFPLDRHNANSD